MTNDSDDAFVAPHDLLPGYVLDSLDPDESERFLGHLGSCVPCQRDLAVLSETVADLATASRVIPPSQVEDELMASLFGGAAEEASIGRRTRAAGDDRSTAAGRRRRWTWPAAAAAAFVLGAGLVATAGALHIGGGGSPVVADGESQLIVDVASAPDAHVMPLELPQGDAKLVVSTDMDMGAVMATDLPMPADGREYHVWTVMDDGSMMSAATFTPDSAGDVSVMLHTGVKDAVAFMLTLESPGAAHPTGVPLAEVGM